MRTTESLERELAARDEVIVALQHVVRELRHELANVQLGQCYADRDLRSLVSVGVES